MATISSHHILSNRISNPKNYSKNDGQIDKQKYESRKQLISTKLQNKEPINKHKPWYLIFVALIIMMSVATNVILVMKTRNRQVELEGEKANVSRLEKEIIGTKKDLHDKTQKFEAKKNFYTQLQNCLDKTHQEKQREKEKNLKLQQDIKNKDSLIRGKKHDVQRVQDKLQNKTSELEKTIKDREEATTDNKRLQAELHEKEEELQSERSKISKLDETIKKILSELKSEKDRVLKLEQELKDGKVESNNERTTQNVILDILQNNAPENKVISSLKQKLLINKDWDDSIFTDIRDKFNGEITEKQVDDFVEYYRSIASEDDSIKDIHSPSKPTINDSDQQFLTNFMHKYLQDGNKDMPAIDEEFERIRLRGVKDDPEGLHHLSVVQEKMQGKAAKDVDLGIIKFPVVTRFYDDHILIIQRKLLAKFTIHVFKAMGEKRTKEYINKLKGSFEDELKGDTFLTSLIHECVHGPDKEDNQTNKETLLNIVKQYLFISKYQQFIYYMVYLRVKAADVKDWIRKKLIDEKKEQRSIGTKKESDASADSMNTTGKEIAIRIEILKEQTKYILTLMNSRSTIDNTTLGTDTI